jgi:hypothetical protein
MAMAMRSFFSSRFIDVFLWLGMAWICKPRVLRKKGVVDSDTHIGLIRVFVRFELFVRSYLTFRRWLDLRAICASCSSQEVSNS